MRTDERKDMSDACKQGCLCREVSMPEPTGRAAGQRQTFRPPFMEKTPQKKRLQRAET